MYTNKEKYIELCKTNVKIPLFSQYYWMDAVCGEDNWDVILVEDSGNILGSLVYYLNPIGDSFEIRKAPLTQNNGVIYYYPTGLKYDRRISFENKVANDVIKQLEQMNIIKYRQYFHYNFTNWLPFYWNGYSQSTRYTYVIDDTSSLDNLYMNFNGNIRKNIKKAQKSVTVFNGMNADEFYELNKQTYERQDIEIPYSYELFKKLYNNLTKQNCIEVLYAKDIENNIHSAALFAYDNDSVYYLMSGSKEEYRDSQALTLLIYEGIKLANKLRKSFDFEGSMKQNIERFFRQFGAEQKQYFDISKEFLINS